MERRLTAGGRGLRVEGLNKKKNELMNTDNSVVIAGGRGGGRRGYWGDK